MYSEKTTIVDVVSLGDDGFSLSITASDLYDAAKSGDVIRRHDISTDAGVHNWAYVGLSEVKLDSNGYTFTFSNGDAFNATLDDDYPASETMSDESGGGSGGGVLVVNVVRSGTELFSGTLPNVSGYAWRSTTAGNAENYYVDFACDLSGATYNELSAVIGDAELTQLDISYSDGIVTLKVGLENSKTGFKSGYTSEEEIAGKTLVLYADKETCLDKTWQEIKDAPVAIIEREVTELGQTTGTTFWKEQTTFEAGNFSVIFIEHMNGEMLSFIAPSASGHPIPITE